VEFDDGLLRALPASAEVGMESPECLQWNISRDAAVALRVEREPAALGGDDAAPYLMTSAFVSHSLATWALVVGLHRDLQSAGLHRTGLWFLAVWGAGLLVAATFPIDLDDAPQTLAGRIHATNGPIIFLSLTIATNLVSRGFKHDVRWHPIHRFTSVLALLMIPEFVAGGVARTSGTGAGIVQRAFIVTFATWFLVVATQLRSNAIRDATRTS